MAMNLTEAEAMLEASQAHPELITQVVPSPFSLHWDRMLKRVLDEGTVGDLLLVDVNAGASFIDTEKPISWREQRKFSGLNAMGLGIMYEALARWVGHAKTVEAHARIFVDHRKNEAGEEELIEIPDHVDVLGELESGASYHLQCSRITGANPSAGDIVFYGSTGTLVLNLGKNTCILHRPDGSTESLTPNAEEQESWRVEAEFIGAIRGEEEIRLTSFKEGVRYMAFTQRVMESSGMV
jgi:predicted dehydrogenase